MRARLGAMGAWPGLAHFGVTPLNFHLYTTAELRAYLVEVEQIAANPRR